MLLILFSDVNLCGKIRCTLVIFFVTEDKEWLEAVVESSLEFIMNVCVKFLNVTFRVMFTLLFLW